MLPSFSSSRKLYTLSTILIYKQQTLEKMALTDKSPMPFGKHKGTAMANVPAKYLMWIKEKVYPNNDNAKAVLKYVMDNIEAIKKELPDESDKD